MTENNFDTLKDAICELVCIAESVICNEGFVRLDNAGADTIDCLDELSGYRAIGTVEEVHNIIKCCLLHHSELSEYRNIGTVEEFKALKEKAEIYEQAFLLLLKDDCKRLPEGWTGSIDELYVGRKQYYLDKVDKAKVLGKIKT